MPQHINHAQTKSTDNKPT